MSSPMSDAGVLIAKLEAATEWSRDLDAEIFVLFHPEFSLFGAINDADCPRYTASFDAAMTLVPKNLDWFVGKGKVRADEPLYGAILQTPFPDSVEVAAVEHATSAILALCSAALRTRAALKLAKDA